jgi:hypothetical protein
MTPEPKDLNQKEIATVLDISGDTYDEALIFVREGQWRVALKMNNARFRVVTARGTAKNWKLLEGAISFVYEVCHPKSIMVKFPVGPENRELVLQTVDEDRKK